MGIGVDFLWFKTSQSAPVATTSADGPAGPITEVIYEIPDRQYSSTSPNEVLFYNVLEDTALATWTWDTYAIRNLSQKPNRRIDLQFGLRISDFDNDYRAVAGIQEKAGTRMDSSSNYPALPGRSSVLPASGAEANTLSKAFWPKLSCLAMSS